MIPTPYTLQVRRRTSSTPGAHGNSVQTLGTAQPWQVHALVPGSMQESAQANRDLSLVAWSVLAPRSDDVPTADDVVEFRGEEYEVEGDPQDYTLGPWSTPFAGVVVELRRTEG